MVVITADAFLYAYFIGMMFIVLGGAVGWLLFKKIWAIFAFLVGFAVVGFIIFPGLLEVL